MVTPVWIETISELQSASSLEISVLVSRSRYICDTTEATSKEKIAERRRMGKESGESGKREREG